MTSQDDISKITAICAYIASAGVTFGDLLNLLDHHAAAFGILIAFMTFVANVLIQIFKKK